MYFRGKQKSEARSKFPKVTGYDYIVAGKAMFLNLLKFTCATKNKTLSLRIQKSKSSNRKCGAKTEIFIK